MQIVSRFFLVIFVLFFLNQSSFAKETSAKSAPKINRVKVLSTMNSGGYTYVEYLENGKKLWLAGPEIKVFLGDDVEFAGAMPMGPFTSKTLNRTFDKILFVSSLSVVSAQSIKVDKIEKLATGLSVEECFTKIDVNAGKTISVRGKIVKLKSGIMGKTWVHLQDGSGSDGTNDLVVTTKSEKKAKVGDTVTAKGVLKKNLDLGAGYFFPAIIEDAQIDK